MVDVVSMKAEDKNMYNSNLAYNTYVQNNVNIESPYKLIEMLYEGILRFNVNAKKAIEENNVEQRTYWLNRSSAVISELKATLNFSHGDVSHYLDGLYSYQLQLLLEAGLQKDSEKVDEVSNVFKGLLEAWREKTHVDQ